MEKAILARVISKRWLALARGMARVIKICKIVSNAAARVISKRWLALARGMARVIKICKIVSNAAARVILHSLFCTTDTRYKQLNK
jgi:hypothetical protein